jgi:hypothetical protein
MVSLDKIAHLAYFILAFLPKSYLLGIHIEPKVFCSVIPAQAGIQRWMPAYAGMTYVKLFI